MRITDESDQERYGNAEIVVRVDPHDGSCKGAHDILIQAYRSPPLWGPEKGPPMHVTLSWGLTVVLSIQGSEEFLEGLDTALGIARQIRADGAYKGWEP